MKILLLGTGNAQLDAIKYLKNNGHYVYAISYKDDEIGRNLADHFEIIDILDKKRAAEFVFKNNIEFVYSIGSDIAMPTIGYISEKLGLPCFVNEYTAELMQNKLSFRNFLKSNGLCNIKYKSASLIKDLIKWNHFPTIIKPVDNQGQRGIYKVNNKNELEKVFLKSLSFSRSKKVIVEEYIQNIEVSVNSFIYNGDFLYHFISRRETIENAPGGVVKTHIMPANIAGPLENKLISLIERTIKKLEILNGPVYFQVKITQDDEIYIIEGTPRLDGCHIWHLIETAYRINLLDLTFKHLLGITLTFPQKQLLTKEKSFRLEFLLKEPGSVFHTKEYDRLSQNHFLNFYYKDGDVIKTINGHLEKVGYYIS